MKSKLAALAFLVAAAGAPPAATAERTVTLAVENMTCSLCAPTVKMSLSRVKGVVRVQVSADKGTAIVIFDDAATDTAALIKATGDAGYPSRLAQ